MPHYLPLNHTTATCQKQLQSSPTPPAQKLRLVGVTPMPSLFGYAILGFALTEAIALFALMVVFLILFAL